MTPTRAPSAAQAGTVRLGDRVVNRLGFGAMRITGPGIWGPPANPEECRAVLRRLPDLDVNFIDTADAYGPYTSEELIAETLYPYPEDMVIGTKAGLVRPGPGEWPPDGRPEHLREAVEGSLRRLRVDRLELLQLHRPDPNVPFQESVGALVQLKAEGKIRQLGLCNVGRTQLTQALAMTEIVSVQNMYNLLERRSEQVLELCAEQGIAFIPWFPLGTGNLTQARDTLAEVASRRGATPAQVALAWLLQHSPVMLPIPGTSRRDHLEENVAAAGLRLAPEDIEALEAA